MDANTKANAEEIISISELQGLVRTDSLFSSMSDDQIARLRDVISEIRHVAEGGFVVNEGEEAKNIYIIKEGAFEVLKKRHDSDTTYPIATLDVGNSIGEVALLDSGKRSASVRAIKPGAVLVIPIAKLNALSEEEESVDIRMKMNLAYEMGRRLRTTNESTVRYLEDHLKEAEMRVEMGKFLTRVLIGLSLYMFAMGLTAALADVIDTTIVNAPILMGFAYGVYRTVKTSPFPMANYGYTLENWQSNIFYAVLWTMPMLGAIVLVKLFMVTFYPEIAGIAVFDLSQGTGLSFSEIVMFSVAYAAFTPVQESVARSGIQCSCQMFLTGRYRILESILLSNLLFSATHLHVGLVMALSVLPIGFFWGWMFWRQGSIVGTSVSHAIIGIFAFFVVGFDFII